MRKALLSLLYATLTVLGAITSVIVFSVVATHYPFISFILFLIGVMWAVIYHDME